MDPLISSGSDQKAGQIWPAFFLGARVSTAALAMLVLSLSAVAEGCQQPAEPEILTAHGVLLAVTQKTFSELESIQLRTEGGEILDFIIEGDTTLTPGHAREHMSFVQPVTVSYRMAGFQRIAVFITD